MELKKYKLGELITQRREKNSESGLPICGVSKEGLIPPKQQEADTSIYNVFYRGDFIFNPARMELNSIAFNDIYEKAICSSLYEVFFVHRTDLILPEYLKLIVKQKWFTRYCEFLGQGSAREYCRFANISEIEIEFPSIDEQRKIVNADAVISNRIEIKKHINDNLEATAQAVLQEKINSNGVETTVDSLIELFDSMRRPMSSLDRSGMARLYPYYGAASLMDYVDDFIFDGIYGLLGEDGTVMDENGYPTMQYVWGKFWVNNHAHIFQGKNGYSTEMVYLILKNTVVRNAVTGAVQLKINQENLRKLPVSVPCEDDLPQLNELIDRLFRSIRETSDEISSLSNLKDILLAKMSD